MYERHHEPLLPRGRFLNRLLWHVGVALLLVAGIAGAVLIRRRKHS
jgi:cytochrome c-type biogenesis protein CcmH/NrfF